MFSVTKRIRKIKQPRGGYIKRTDFKVIKRYNENELNDEENIHAGLVGLAVDYMTRFMMGTLPENAFEISLRGASIIKDNKNAKKLLDRIKGLDDESIRCACKLSGYDVCYRAGKEGYKPVSEINPDKKTIENICIMVKRSVKFWEEYGPIIRDGFTFEGGYTAIISAGDGDYLTKDTLWDFKVSKQELKSKYTLQILVYYLMGIHSKYDEFNSIEKLGIYNPRKNVVYLLNISDISLDIINKVSHDVIGYGMTKQEMKADLIEGGISPILAEVCTSNIDL